MPIMSKLPLIIKREYLAKVRNKSFIVMTILSPILMVGMVALVIFLARVNNDEKRYCVKKQTFYYFFYKDYVALSKWNNS